MLRKRTLFVLIVGLIGLAAWRLPFGPEPVAEAAPRMPFPGFNLETLDGRLLTQEELRGRVALVTFWASWCGSCRVELPVLDSINSALDHPDFLVLGINEDTNERSARFLVEELGLEMEQLLGRGHQQQRYGYWGLPYSVLIDRDGGIVDSWYGYPGRRALEKKIADAMQLLLEESGKPQAD